ncbi:MAG: hypothetical protein Q4E38_04730 [Eubacteriales bacterium]|nr:hypothetical protein [Eubacteriales bacterium]
MKRILAMLLVLVMALSLSACHKHSWEPATCDKPKTCSECGKTDGDPLGHKWGEPVYEWAEDLSSVTALRICGNDPSHTESETVETTREETKSPTCTEAGETVFSAQFTNGVFAPQSRTEALPEALGHAWGEPEYEWAEDLSSVIATRVCTHDPSHVETEIAETVSKVTKAATCTEAGERVYSVTFGNEAFEPLDRLVEDGAPLGHLWEQPSFEWADDMSSVTATRVCARDASHVETETAAVTAEIVKPATCEERGETAYTAVFENPGFEAQSRTESNIEALGHEWGEPEYVWAEDLSSVTATRVCAHDASHVETETAAVTAEIVKPATCEEKGETAYSASFLNQAFEAQNRTETDIEALGHDWAKATHTQPQTCKACGKTEGEALPIHYFDMRFKDYRYAFNHAYPGFLYIDATKGKGFTLHVKGDRIIRNGLDETIRFYHADEFDRGPVSSLQELKRFNLIEISYVSDSDEFDTSISARVAQFGYYAAKILDPDLGMTAFFKDGLDLFDAKGNEQSFTHNGFVYTLACEQDGGHYRYSFRMTLESNLE